MCTHEFAIYLHTLPNSQIDRQRDRDRWKYRQTNRQIDKERDGQIDGQTDTKKEGAKEIIIKRERKKERTKIYKRNEQLTNGTQTNTNKLTIQLINYLTRSTLRIENGICIGRPSALHIQWTRYPSTGMRPPSPNMLHLLILRKAFPGSAELQLPFARSQAAA